MTPNSGHRIALRAYPTWRGFWRGLAVKWGIGMPLRIAIRDAWNEARPGWWVE